MRTRLFHAIVVVGASLGVAPLAACIDPGGAPCPTDAAANDDGDAAAPDPIDATPGDVPCEHEPGWSPTK